MAVAVVSGASGVVGGGIAAGLLGAGFTVIAPVRSDKSGQAVRDEVGSSDQLDVVVADISSNEGTAALVQHIKDKYGGQVDHVVSSCGAWWQKGMLSEVDLDEFNAQLANLITGHFQLYKALIHLVKDDAASSFTFITGAAGEYCFMPPASMVTVGAAGAFGVAGAAMGEARGAGFKRRIVEMRIASLIRRDKDENNNNFGGAPSFSNRLIGAQAVKIVKGDASGTVRITNEVLSA